MMNFIRLKEDGNDIMGCFVMILGKQSQEGGNNGFYWLNVEVLSLYTINFKS